MGLDVRSTSQLAATTVCVVCLPGWRFVRAEWAVTRLFLSAADQILRTPWSCWSRPHWSPLLQPGMCVCTRGLVWVFIFLLLFFFQISSRCISRYLFFAWRECREKLEEQKSRTSSLRGLLFRALWGSLGFTLYTKSKLKSLFIVYILSALDKYNTENNYYKY